VSDSQRPAVAPGGSSRPAVEVAAPWPVADASRTEAEIDLSRYVQALQGAWKLITAGAIVGALGGLGASLLRPTQYEAATTITIDNPTPQTAAMFRASAQANTLAAETLHELGLDQPPYSITPQVFVDRQLQIEPVAGTNLVKIKVRMQDPAKAAAASALISAKAVALSKRLASTGNLAAAEQVKVQLDASTIRLHAAEQQLLKYQREAQVEVLQTDTDAMLGQRGDLLRQQIAIEAEKATLASSQEQIQKQQPFLPVPSSMQGQSGATEKGVINPAYQTLAEQIAKSQTNIAGMERERREAVGVRKLGGQFPELNELYARQLEIARLQTDYGVAKQVYADLALRYQQSQLTVGGTLQVVDPAVPPVDPLPRRRLESIALGLTGGVLLAALMTLLLGFGKRDSHLSTA
jgi:uncharacterized protein involved in exopolysaccharide biosynthesis